MLQGSPEFLIPQRSRAHNFWDNLATMCETRSPRLEMVPGFYSRVLLVRPRWGLRRAFLTSVFFHSSVIFFLLYSPSAMLWDQYFPPTQLPLAVIAKDPRKEILYLPVLKIPGPGGKPGKGFQPGPIKRGGSPRVDLRFTAASNPPQPDNKRQTILQPPKPPQLRIPHEVPMPDLLLATVKVAVPQPPPKPRLEVPIATIRRPQPKPPTPPKAVPQVPQPPAAVAELALIRPATIPNLSPKLVLPEPPPPDADPRDTLESLESPPMVFPGLESSVDLVSLSVNPDALNGLVSLPFGNREGEFSISPDGGEPAALGGSADGIAGAGWGVPGAGGDSSAGIGNGSTGGGGGDSGFSGSVTITPRENAGSLGELPAMLRNWIFPVGDVPVVSRGGFIISSGPTGGGGLRIYGVLRGGKVYTTYLSMPERNWVLEYSLKISDAAAGTRSGTIQLSMENGLAPPFPKQKFDFYRPASVPQRSTRKIVLHGVIREDGSVEDLKVLEGVQADADELARMAFSQWKFRPASRGNQPVAVEILVGIPASGPLRPAPESDAPLLTRAP